MSFLASFLYRQFLHSPPAPTTSFAGKTAIVTGSNVGLGLEASRLLIQLGASTVILACRNVSKGKSAAEDIQATTSCGPEALQVWHLDMSSYASVQAFAARVHTELPRLDVLIANAGIRTGEFRITEDNEETITTNVVSLSLLAFLLHPKLRQTANEFDTQTHVTVTASELYEVAKFQESKAPEGQLFQTLNDKDKANMADRYNVSKLLEILIVRQIAALSPLSSSNVIVNCVAPGFCHSDLTREVDTAVVRVAKKLLCRPTAVGARTLVFGAGAEPESHGQYLPDCVIAMTLKGICKGESGDRLQERVWVELKGKLEAVREGVTDLS